MSASDKASSRKRTHPKWSRADQAAMLDAIAAAPDVDALEQAIQTRGHPFSGPKWRAISAARVKRGEELCDAHPHGQLVPRVGARRRMTCCGETRSVADGIPTQSVGTS